MITGFGYRPLRPSPAPSRRRPTSLRPASAGRLTAGTTATLAARLRQLAAQAEYWRAVAEFRRYAADQQARLDALLLEAIDALASLFSEARQPGNRPA